MVQKIILTLALLMFLAGYTALAQSPEEVHQRVSKAIEAEATAQKKADDWSWNKKDLIDQIRDLKTRVTWLKYQKDKHDVYIKRVKQNIADLEFKKAEALRVREQLDPYLEQVVNELDEFVKNDMPFLTEERQRRLTFLRENVLNNYQLEMSEKLRQVLEALQVETKYGSNVLSMDTTLNLKGADTEVTLILLGRVTMFYLTLDNAHVGRWDKETRQWEQLPDRFIRPIRRLLDIADRKRIVELIELPLGALKE
jgi:hypothetical protein